MNPAYHTTTTVLPGRRIEVSVPDLQVGDPVQVIVIFTAGAPRAGRRSALDIIQEYKGPPLFGSEEAVEEYLRQERDSWE
jgi:hypothetical protein